MSLTHRGRGYLPRSPTTLTTTSSSRSLREFRNTVTELRCCEVRWFFRKKAADTKWVPFKGLDSLRLEIRYRDLHELEVDVQTLHKITEENIVVGDQVVVLDGLFKASDDLTSISALYWKDDSSEIRRGTWFLPDWQPIRAEMAKQIEEHHLQHFRGQTIPEGTSMFSDKEASKKPQLTELQTENYEVKWSSVIDIFLYNTTKASRILRYISWGKPANLRRGYEKEAEWTDGVPNFSHLILVVHGIGQKGYENLIAENTAQVRDAVYQMLEKHFPDEKTRPMFLPIEWRSSLVLDGGVTDQLTLPKMATMRGALNSTAMDIMYYQSPLYRKEIIAGVVRQLNSVYNQFMQHNPSFTGPVSVFAHSLGSVITYDILTSWSPLLMYDQYVTKAIDEHMKTMEDEKARESMVEYQAARERMHSSIEGGMKTVLVTEDEKLAFKVKYLFAVGSPLAVFLVMRGAQKETLLPDHSRIERIYNIFHPYDPVAYRLEPLFAGEYKNVRPVKIFSSHDLRGRNPYDDLPMDLHKSYLKKLKAQNAKDKKKENRNSQALSDSRSPAEDEIEEEDEDSDDEDATSQRSACSSPRPQTPPLAEDGTGKVPVQTSVKRGWFWGSSTTSNGKEKNKDKEKEKEKGDQVEVAKEAAEEKPEKVSELERLLENVAADSRIPCRIDFSLQPALTEKSYWSVLKSHFAYWTNNDMALLLVNVLYSKTTKAQKAEEKATEAEEAESECREGKENVPSPVPTPTQELMNNNVPITSGN